MFVAGPKTWIGLILLVLLPGTALGQGRIRAEAFLGEPFGVGRLEVDFRRPPRRKCSDWRASAWPRRTAASSIRQPNAARDILPIVKNVLGQARRPGLENLGRALESAGLADERLFSFCGARAAEANGPDPRKRVLGDCAPWPIRTDTGATFAPGGGSSTAGPAFWEKRPDYPPLVENYLRAMLAKRLNLPLPGPPQSETWLDQFTKDLGLTMGTEGLRINYQREQFLGPAASARRSISRCLRRSTRPSPRHPRRLATCGSSRLPTRAVRVPLCPFRQFFQFPLVPRHAGPVAGRFRESRRQPGAGL